MFIVFTKMDLKVVLASMKEVFVKSKVEHGQSNVNVWRFLNEFEANGVGFFLLAKEVLED